MDKNERREKVVEVLNKARSMELYAISQYMVQHYALDAMDYGELAKNMKLIAIDEMRHAEQFAERIKDLDGEPTTELADKISRGQEVETIFTFDAEVEEDTVDVYNQFLQTCREMGDNISARLFEIIIEEEQEHADHFDNVGGHIKKLGDAYLSRIAGTSASTGPSTKGFVRMGGDEA
jgi:bacterioferritin